MSHQFTCPNPECKADLLYDRATLAEIGAYAAKYIMAAEQARKNEENRRLEQVAADIAVKKAKAAIKKIRTFDERFPNLMRLIWEENLPGIDLDEIKF